MPDVHVPHLEEEEDGDPSTTPRQWKTVLRIGLEVLLITTGVFLG